MNNGNINSNGDKINNGRNYNYNRFNLENIGTNVVHSDYMRQLRNQQMYNIPNLASVTMPSCDRIQSDDDDVIRRNISCERSVMTLSLTEAQSVCYNERIVFNRHETHGGAGIKYLTNGDIEICRCGLCSLYFRIRSSPGSTTTGVFLDGEEVCGGRFSTGFFETSIVGRIIIPLCRERHLLSLRNLADSTLRLASQKCNEPSVSMIVEIE